VHGGILYKPSTGKRLDAKESLSHFTPVFTADSSLQCLVRVHFFGLSIFFSPPTERESPYAVVCMRPVTKTQFT
jgi:hypothetical protein